MVLQNVKKRDGSVKPYVVGKIESAVYKACLEVDGKCDLCFAETVALEIDAELSKREFSNGTISVEELQDVIEEKLMEVNKPVAKRYIIYRDNKNKNRATKKKFKHLSDEFLSKYKHRESPLNALGNFVFYRTYSRFLPEEGRREYWWETLARAVDFNCGLVPNTTRVEAEALYDNIYNLRQQLSGEYRPSC